MLKEYSEILENIATCSPRPTLKIEAQGATGLSKIEHQFSFTLITEEQVQEFDRITVSCLRKVFNLNNNKAIRTMF